MNLCSRSYSSAFPSSPPISQQQPRQGLSLIQYSQNSMDIGHTRQRNTTKERCHIRTSAFQLSASVSNQSQESTKGFAATFIMMQLGKPSFVKLKFFGEIISYLYLFISNTLKTLFKIISFLHSKNGGTKINRDFIKGGRGASILCIDFT